MSDWFRATGLSAAKVIGDQLRTIKEDIVGPVDALNDGSPMSMFVCDLQRKVESLENKCRLLEGSARVDVKTLDLSCVEQDLGENVQALSNCIDLLEKDMEVLKRERTNAEDENKKTLQMVSQNEKRHEDEINRLRTAKDEQRNQEIDRLREQFANRIAHLDSELKERDDRIKILEKKIVDGASESNRKYQSSEKALIDMYAIFDEFQRDKEKTFRRIAIERESERASFQAKLEDLNMKISENESLCSELKSKLNSAQFEMDRLNGLRSKEISQYERLKDENGALQATLHNLSPITGSRIEKYLIKEMLISFWKADERVRYQALRPILSLLEFKDDEMKGVLNDSGESIGQMFIRYVDERSKANNQL